MTRAVATRTMDGEQARRRAAWALTFHDGALQAARMSVVNAVACGVQLAKAKAEMPHGEFGKWRKRYAPALANGTAHRYMSLRARLAAELPGFARVEKLLDVDPATITPEQAERVVARVGKLVESRSLNQLYLDFGVIKPRETPSRKAARKLPARTGDRNTDNAARGSVWVDKVLAELKGADLFAEFLADDDLNRLVEGMTSAAAELGVPLTVAKG